MRAAVMIDTSGALTIVDLVIDKPRNHEVLVRTVGSGLCHSDLHYLDHPGLAATLPLPALLGHECAGIVEEVGSDVTYVKPGDHVITCLSAFCGECEFCLCGRPVLCSQSPRMRGPGSKPRLTFEGGEPVTQLAGIAGFAEQLLVHEHAVVKIDPDYPLDRAAIIGCGVATGLGSVLNSAAVRPGSTVAIIGCGGVGLAIVQGAVIAGARRVIVIDTHASKFELARSLGATDCVDASNGDPVEEIVEMTLGGVDYSFEAIGLKSTAQQSFEMLRPGGIATIVGLGRGQSCEIDMVKLVGGERSVKGSMMGSGPFRSDLPRYIELDQQGRLNLGAMIDSQITLDDIDDGFDAMRQGLVNGRNVITFDF